MLFHLFLFFFFIGCSSPKLTNIIKPVKLKPGVKDTLLLSDMFYAKNYNITPIENSQIEVEVIKGNKLILKPNEDIQGATLLEFKLDGNTYSIPIFLEDVNKTIKYKFHYKPGKKVKQVSVAGSFNNWNRSSNLLTDEDGDGIYVAVVPLQPGNYVYKFNVDGKDILDPSNNETEPTGFDGFNSVLKIRQSKVSKDYLYVLNENTNSDNTIVNFVYDKGDNNFFMGHNDVIALLNNQLVASSSIKVNGNKIEVTFSKDELSGRKLLRLLVVNGKHRSNMQSVFFFNGKPDGNEKEHITWHDGSIYSIMIDRFNDGDSSLDKPVQHDSLFKQANYEGGDLQGIINKINEGYFNSLGINVLWISPVYDNPNDAYRESQKPYRWYSGYHGYWPISENKVEEKFGTMATLQKLVKTAHKHGIKVLLDIVAHHVHIENPLYKEHHDWFGTLMLPDGRRNLRLWDEQRLTTWFEPYMPSFDYTKTDAPINYMTDNCVWWLKQTGADGFRHDAVKHVPNRFWRALTKKLEEEIEIPTGNKVYQIGETFGDYKLIGSYVNNGQLSAQFDFNLSYSAIPIILDKEKSFTELDVDLHKAISAFGYHHLMGNIMDSHDKVRFMAYADGDVPKQGVDMREMAWTNPPKVDHASSYKKAELYYSFIFTIPGIPVIYYGSEFGMTGADDPDNRRMMRFGNQLDDLEKGMLKVTSSIVHMRNEHSALRYGDFKTIYVDDNIYAYKRADVNEKLIIVLNKSENKQSVELPIPSVYNSTKLTDVISNETINANNSSAKVNLDGYGWRVFKLE